jgi:CrcB protein
MIPSMSRSLIVIAAVALGGAVGAVARHGLSLAVAARFDGARWPATLIANLAGCLLIGIAWRLMEHHAASPAIRGLLLTGVLGAFTTYSTFGLDVLHLMEARRTGFAAAYVGISVVAGLLLVRLGHDLTQAMLGSVAGDAGG